MINYGSIAVVQHGLRHMVDALDKLEGDGLEAGREVVSAFLRGVSESNAGCDDTEELDDEEGTFDVLIEHGLARRRKGSYELPWVDYSPPSKRKRRKA